MTFKIISFLILAIALIGIIGKIKIFLNLFLVLLSIALKWILFPLGVIWTLLSLLFILDRYNAKLFIQNWLYKISISQDQLGNVMFQIPLNDIFLKKSVHLFGNEDETISYVLGINKANLTLSFTGKILAYLLNLLDPNHVEKAVQNNE